jgi:Domain of unknown function (DUF4915)
MSGPLEDSAPSYETMLVTGFGDDGRGGTFALRDGEPALLDPIPCTGVATRDGRIARLVRAPGELTSTCELLISDDRGVVEYHRLDAIRDPHDIRPGPGGWIIVSTGTNEIVALEGDALHTLWAGNAMPDSCHVNCITEVDGDLWATAFGWFDGFKGWRDTRAVGAGVLWNLRTGEEITGFSHPHTPRHLGDDWFVCESLTESFVRRDRIGRELQRVDLGGYTRGVAFVDDCVHVGVSARREHPGSDAHVAILDRESLSVLGRIPLPCSEIYELIVVPADLAAGVGNGFVRRDQLGELLDRQHCGCRVRAELPDRMQPSEPRVIEVGIENTGAVDLVSRPPHPVFVATRWIAAHADPIDGDRVPLPVALPPGGRTHTTVPIQAPTAGRYELVLSLVHEGHFWFDELDAANGARREVIVG